MKDATMTKQQWIELFREIGLDEAAMTRWHQVFESRHPESHRSFLSWLNLSAGEIERIRSL